MSKSTSMSAKIAALTALVEEQRAMIETLAKRPPVAAQRRSDFRIVIVRDIPSKRDGGTYSQIEVYDNLTGERIVDAFIDREIAAGKRQDGGNQAVVYASRRKTQAAATPAPAHVEEEADSAF